MLRNLLPKLKMLQDLSSLQKMKISRNLSTLGKLADKPLFLYGLYTCILAPAFYVYSGDVIGQYCVWKASTLRKWLEDAEAELEQLRKGKEKGLREAEEQAAMEKARDEALESGVSLTHEELSTKVLGKGKNPKYLRGLGVSPTPISLSFKSHLESRAHSELLSFRSEMELLREEQQREREVYQREREERERERQEERDRFARLESRVTKFLDTRGTP